MPPIAYDDPATQRRLGEMRVSVERGRTRDIDAHKVARGDFPTRSDAWLVGPVDAFLRRHLAARDAVIVTNPPHLASFSARRKGVISLAGHYYGSKRRVDLYMVALDRCRAAADVVVAIVPETLLLSAYPKDELELAVVVEARLFEETTVPVVVACFRRGHRGGPVIYKGARAVGPLHELLAMRPDIRLPHNAGGPEPGPAITFNAPDGALGLRAVDAVEVGRDIGFVVGADFGYPRERIKPSSRLMTYVDVEGLPPDQIEALVATANARLSALREATADLVLAPFKGDRHDGRRRRRLDYALARRLLRQALAELNPRARG